MTQQTINTGAHANDGTGDDLRSGAIKINSNFTELYNFFYNANQVATFSALPSSPTGLYLVLADETKGGAASMYFFTSTHRYWIAMVQDA